MNELFFQSKYFGTLYFEYCLFEFESEPILFVCRDGAEKRYLCLCTEFRLELKWIIAPLTLEVLKAAFEHQYDLAALFQLHSFVLVVKKSEAGVFQEQTISCADLDPLDLPASGTFLMHDAEAEKFYEKKLQHHVSIEQDYQVVKCVEYDVRSSGVTRMHFRKNIRTKPISTRFTMPSVYQCS